MKPQVAEEAEEDAPDHVHVPALQGRLRLAVGYYSRVASGINKRSRAHTNAGPGISSMSQQGKWQLLVLSQPRGETEAPACLPVTVSKSSARLDHFLSASSQFGCE